MLAEVTQDVGGRSGIQEIFATPFEYLDTLRTQPAGEHEANDLIQSLPFGINIRDDDCDKREQRGDGVRPMIGGIGHQQTRTETLGLSTRILVETFLDD